MPDKKPDQYDEMAAKVVHSREHSEDTAKAIAAFGRQCAKEARREAFLEAAKAVAHASDIATHGSGTIAGLNVAAVYLKREADESKEGEG